MPHRLTQVISLRYAAIGTAYAIIGMTQSLGFEPVWFPLRKSQTASHPQDNSQGGKTVIPHPNQYGDPDDGTD